MRVFNRLAAIFLFVLALLPTPRGYAGEPTAQLSATVNELVTILVNTPVAELRAKGLPERALKLVYDRFDFSELTKRSLGRHWQALDESEQREFVNALTQKLLVAYGRTVRASGDEKVEFKSEVVEGNFANVQTRDYRQQWRVPDRLSHVGQQWTVESLRYGDRERQYREQLSRPVRTGDRALVGQRVAGHDEAQES